MKAVSIGTASLPGSAPTLHFPLAALAAWYLGLFALRAALRRKMV